ncbi:DNA adenine methylase [Psychrobacter pygoscelis]|uniref:DNA adenine methylase n=1 Tax=Psychrobacter pygoscelis TaxID=2488563 RepID=UPI001039EB57|nr:DNA adenine methylase [Psychrobacter pygoscelis]
MSNTAPKLYSKAPIPFVGQKRNFLKAFRLVIEDNIPNDDEGWTVIDVFGGSGLLANNVKHLRPMANVIYNDFDNYSQRLELISDTNRLRNLLKEAIADQPRNKKLDIKTRGIIKKTIKDFDGFIDLQTICPWLLFSGKQVSSIDELFNHTMYNCIRCSDYPSADGYLDGISIVSESFEVLMAQYGNREKTLFVLDPPYVNTKQGAYALNEYFGMVQFLRLMKLVRPPYILFSSTRSELLSYMDYLKDNVHEDWVRLGNYEKVSQVSRINKTASYIDNMIYRWDWPSAE